MAGVNVALARVERIERAILLLRGQKVMLDSDLAALDGVSVGRLNEAVKRNKDRFPADFMFQLNQDEVDLLRRESIASGLKSQIAISKSGHGGRRFRPYAFTEQGVAMLSSVLRSQRSSARQRGDHADVRPVAALAGHTRGLGAAAGCVGKEIRLAIPKRIRGNPTANASR